MKNSKILVISIGTIFGIGIIFAGLLFYSYSQISVSLTDVSYHSIDWADFSFLTLIKLGLNVLSGDWLNAAFDLIEGVNLNLFFEVTNNGILPVYIPDISYDLMLNGINVGKGVTPINDTIYPGKAKEVITLQNFQKTSFEPAVSSIVEKEGVLEIHIKGTAHLNIFGFELPVPFESSKKISVYDEIRTRLLGEL